MIKYCFILDNETGHVKLGAGCSDEYYKEIGMVQRDVEQSEKDNEWYLIDKCPHYTQEEIEEMENQRIANLTMTALDFINFIRSCGLSLADIKEYLSLHEELDVQLTYCQNVYCGIVKAIAPIEYKGIIITDDMIEHAFKVKNGMV